MVKIKQWEYPPFTWKVSFEHYPYGSNPPNGTWHLVHEYDVFGPDYPFTSFGSHWYPTAVLAHLAALHFVAMPLLVTDLCPWCRYQFPEFGHYPKTPRMNIYRGHNELPNLPAIYWDWWNPDPPPGYSWT